jgi:hypothetical protein
MYLKRTSKCLLHHRKCLRHHSMTSRSLLTAWLQRNCKIISCTSTCSNCACNGSNATIWQCITIGLYAGVEVTELSTNKQLSSSSQTAHMHLGLQVHQEVFGASAMHRQLAFKPLLLKLRELSRTCSAIDRSRLPSAFRPYIAEADRAR